MKNITKEQKEFLDECTWGTWKLNPKNGLVDVDRNFNCSRMGLSDFMGIEFGNINGIFRCSFNRLVYLKGAPKKVGKSFICTNNQLVSLEGAPQEVHGYFSCANNQLVSLEGAPQEVGGDFDCSNNQLVSLEGAPEDVGGNFYCSNVSLEGAPEKIDYDLFFDPISLSGCSINLINKIHFWNGDEYIKLKPLLNKVSNGLFPEIYFKKMI